MKAQDKMKIGYDITMDKGSLKPTKVTFWKDEKHFQKHQATAPLKYLADAMVGLSLVHLNQFLKSPVHMPHMNYSFAHEAWKTLDPHHELYKRSQERVLSLQSHQPQLSPPLRDDFESKFNEALETMQKPWGMDLTSVVSLVQTISDLESHLKNPLLFNFGVKFSKAFVEKLHALYSFLFHLRSLIAVDHNGHVDDSSHEAVKVDAITDYLPKSEYIVNDALLYFNFMKLTKPFSGNHSDGRVEKLMTNPLQKAFHKYSHNACCLIDNLPSSFLTSMNPVELEEALYLVQMDWLLGSEAGLMFKIREELYGIQNGYENIFWNEVELKDQKHPVSLSICCELSEKHIHANQAA